MKLNLTTHPGYVGMFTKNEAEGAYPNGTRVKKIAVEDGDSHPIGAKATILGSIKTPAVFLLDGDMPPYFYFLEWDDAPKIAVGCASWKITKIEMGKE